MKPHNTLKDATIRSIRLIRLPEVINLTGLSRSTIDRMEDEKEFPQRRKLSERAVGWSLSEVQEWINRRSDRNE